MSGLYIHIPFCKQRCIYCNFYSSTLFGLKERYISALCKEMVNRKDYLKGEPVNTIYLGGGTPSLLQNDDLKKVFDTISETFGTDANRETTLEANPDDLHKTYLDSLVSLPINRLSIGIQTFDDHKLRLLNRRHTARQAIDAVKNAQTAGFDNISIDLIYGLPGQNLEAWERDIEQAIALQVQHISAYSLTYEEGTPIYNKVQKGEIAETDDDASNTFFTRLMDKLAAAGFEHYEISNFSLPGRCSRHNSSYWEETPYLGCGASAHSYDRRSREWNVSSVKAYIEGIEQGARQFEREQLDEKTRYNELIITSLRKRTGLSLIKLKEEYGDKYLNYCLEAARKYIGYNELQIAGDYLRLTRKGLFLSNAIMSDLLSV